mmetsp:Transcript_10643/g.32596  ORF Transcript_10643/g.32596 Transcript_10643/m.32596 type:complete len:119 (+) Transcript_10643:671-1027(+)
MKLMQQPGTKTSNGGDIVLSSWLQKHCLLPNSICAVASRTSKLINREPSLIVTDHTSHYLPKYFDHAIILFVDHFTAVMSMPLAAKSTRARTQKEFRAPCLCFEPVAFSRHRGRQGQE